MKYPKIHGARVLVTGGAGFIGSHLCASLLAEKNEVVCLDNLSTGAAGNIGDLQGRRGFTFTEGDIRNYADCVAASKGCDVILHQAALGSVPRSIKDPATTHDVNLTGFLNVLNAARQNNVRHTVYATSSSVYGDSRHLPKAEHTIGAPLSPYAVTKRANELYAQVYASTFGMKVTGLRYFNVFGPRQNPEGEYAAAIPRFIRSLIRHESPLIHGDGTSSRDFTYVDNIVKLNHLAVMKEHAAGEIFNGAAGETADLNTLVVTLRELLSRHDAAIASVDIRYGPERQGDIRHSHASIEKARSVLGYEPSHSFRQGLEDAVEWYWNKVES
jgi:UDP-N-acetylglucosamine/UDP-N-acetylgalactosamine 4-epimerase